jgi:hypothetical protein
MEKVNTIRAGAEITIQDGTESVQKTASSIPTRKATGPRTSAGKERIKNNALKHGIFSKVALLKNESRPEFDSLLDGLFEDLQPIGMLERILVEKLATNLWRRRRALIAEGAEIENGMAFLAWDEKQRQEKDLQASRVRWLKYDSELIGLMDKMENPQVLGRCLQVLEQLKDHIETTGLNSEFDQEALTELYGNRARWTRTLADTYEAWSDTAACSDQEREQNGYALPEQCKIEVLEEVEKEIARLKRYQKVRSSTESERLQLESLRKNVPDAPQLDRLLRYETTLARDFDRTFSQLEGLQRMRKGQPVLPPIKVDVCFE